MTGVHVCIIILFCVVSLVFVILVLCCFITGDELFLFSVLLLLILSFGY